MLFSSTSGNNSNKRYDKLVNDYHYSPGNVHLRSSAWYCKYPESTQGDWFGHNMMTDSIVDGEDMWGASGVFDIKDALDAIAANITKHDSLMIVIIAHGWNGGFIIHADIPRSEAERNPEEQETGLTYKKLGTYINSKFGNGYDRKYAVMIVVDQACYSGTMMNHLYGQNRILISAAKSNEEAHTFGNFHPPEPAFLHFAFIYMGRHAYTVLYPPVIDEYYDGFIKSIGNINTPVSVLYAFEKGYTAARNNYLEKAGVGIIYDGRSTPQIDDNFNGLTKEDGDNGDGQYAARIYL